jgi:hypothetical protein
MGYYTRYELEIQNGSNDLIQELREFSEVASWAIDKNGLTEDEAKWYDHQEELQVFSKLHPTVIFKLIGVGEDSQDFWHEYYMDGKMQNCKGVITYPQFNSDLLE